MFDLVGQGGTITINGRPAGTLKTWWFGVGTTPDRKRVKRVRAEVALSPIYKRLGASGTARVVLDPRKDAFRPARLTLEGPITDYTDGVIILMPVEQLDAEIVDVRKP